MALACATSLLAGTSTSPRKNLLFYGNSYSSRNGPEFGRRRWRRLEWDPSTETGNTSFATTDALILDFQ